MMKGGGGGDGGWGCRVGRGMGIEGGDVEGMGLLGDVECMDGGQGGAESGGGCLAGP